jgi:hypothetical protein
MTDLPRARYNKAAVRPFFYIVGNGYIVTVFNSTIRLPTSRARWRPSARARSRPPLSGPPGAIKRH